MGRKKKSSLKEVQLEELENDKSKIGWLPEDILHEIISFFEPEYRDNRHILRWNLPYRINGLTELARMGAVSKMFNRLSRDRKHWLVYYRSLYPIAKIGPTSVHIGDQTWASCRIGFYPGWSHIHDPIPVSVARCTCPHHYGDTLEDVNKSVRWKDPFKMSARRTWTLVKKQYVWNRTKEVSLRNLERRMAILSETLSYQREVRYQSQRVPQVFAIHRMPLPSSVKRSRNRQKN